MRPKNRLKIAILQNLQVTAGTECRLMPSTAQYELLFMHYSPRTIFLLNALEQQAIILLFCFRSACDNTRSR